MEVSLLGHHFNITEFPTDLAWSTNSLSFFKWEIWIRIISRGFIWPSLYGAGCSGTDWLWVIRPVTNQLLTSVIRSSIRWFDLRFTRFLAKSFNILVSLSNKGGRRRCEEYTSPIKYSPISCWPKLLTGRPAFCFWKRCKILIYNSAVNQVPSTNEVTACPCWHLLQSYVEELKQLADGFPQAARFPPP